MLLEETILACREIQKFYTVLCVKPFSLGSQSLIVTHENGDAEIELAKARGFSYFLDSEDLNPIFDYGKEHRLPDYKLLEMVLHYAIHDAYPSWINAR